MNTAAELAHHWSGGPGPWILLFPLVWAAVIVGLVTLARRAGWRRGGAPWAHRAATTPSAVDILSRRFAEGEIDENEYWQRLSVLNESFHSGSKDGAQ